MNAATVIASPEVPGFGTDPWWLVGAKALVIFVFLVVMTLFCDLVGAARRRSHAAPDRPEPGRPAGPAAESRRRHQAGAEGGHHPEGRRQGGLRPRADHLRHPGLHGLRGDAVRAGGVHLRPSHQPAAHRPAGGRPVHPRGRLGRHLRHRARRLVERIDVPAARRAPLVGADDLLRGRDGALVRRRVPLRRLDVDLRDRRGAGRLLVRRAALPVVRDLRDLDGR